MALLQLNQVTRRYTGQGVDVDVLGGIDLSVADGEFVAIVGFSGSGKTTLISLMAGLETPTSGEVLFDGRPVAGPGPERGVVYQNYS